MDVSLTIKATLVLSGMGLVLGALLAVASNFFAVEIDPRVERILEVLPGLNCGACGYAGCEGAAEGIAKEEAPITACTAGGHEVTEQVAVILGKEVEAKGVPPKAQARCGGGRGKVALRYIYDGEVSCHMAQQVACGPLLCPYGCLGFGDCVEVCPLGAITIGEDHLPRIDWERCRGCGLCVETCPRNIIALVPETSQVDVFCSSPEKGKAVRSVCEVGCIACKSCEKVCEFGAIKVENNLAVIDYDKCTGCGKCVEKCPTKCLVAYPKKDTKS